MDSVALFGGTGFVGSYLTHALLQKGYRVLVLRRRESQFCFPISHENLFLINSENDLEASEAAKRCPDLRAFVHLAANVNVGESLQAPEKFIADNLELTRRSIQCQRAHWPQAPVIFLSSDRVFGKSQGLVDEASSPSPADPYGMSKWLSEELVRFFSAMDGVTVVTARAANLYGPFQRSAQFVPSVFRKLWQGQREIQVGNLNVQRNFLYITDLVSGLVALMDRGIATASGVLHFGHQLEPLTAVTSALTELAQHHLGYEVKFVSAVEQFRSGGVELKPFQLGCERAKKLLGWTAKVDLNSGLSHILIAEGKKNGIVRNASPGTHP